MPRKNSRYQPGKSRLGTKKVADELLKDADDLVKITHESRKAAARGGRNANRHRSRRSAREQFDLPKFSKVEC